MTREILQELIEDYAAAKATGRPDIIRFTIARLNQALSKMFPEQENLAQDDPKKE